MKIVVSIRYELCQPKADQPLAEIKNYECEIIIRENLILVNTSFPLSFQESGPGDEFSPNKKPPILPTQQS